jgi:RNA polymerase sigma factor (sigma-70 family)
MSHLTPEPHVFSAFNELFRQAQLGSPEAMQIFFDKSHDTILRVIRARMNREMRSTWDSADFMQRTSQKLHSCNIKDMHFETPQAFLGYLLKIAQNEVHQEKRKLHNRMKANGQIHALSQEEEEQAEDLAPDAHDVFTTEEKWQEALASLSVEYQAVAIQLREGYTHREIAAALKISERTVRRVVYLLRKLYLGDEKDES